MRPPLHSKLNKNGRMCAYDTDALLSI